MQGRPNSEFGQIGTKMTWSPKRQAESLAPWQYTPLAKKELLCQVNRYFILWDQECVCGIPFIQTTSPYDTNLNGPKFWLF